MKVAICQLNIVWESKEQNLCNVEKYLIQAQEENADVVFFPEMSFTGFSMNTAHTAESNNYTCNQIKKLAVKYKLSIGFGWVKQTLSDKAENHYTLIDNNGEILMDYVKIHPFSFSNENKFFDAGNDLFYCNVADFKIGTLICYDLRFPEIFQILSDKVDCIVVAANWPEVRREHWQCLLKARAIENQVYIIGVNCVGNINNINYSGDSCIIVPDGNVLKSISYTERLIIHELDNDVEDFRKKFPTKADRKQVFGYFFVKKPRFRTTKPTFFCLKLTKR
ncbi:MAG: carbon-nitrogen family hydrolase [Bacteroidales bacterium]|jgi:predicted amidohydrolase|nr:carbon-nitrogen family hydrolase [Bacteroidales bacterium]